MMMPIQFSVVIPLYNKRKSILAALQSVLDQRYQPVEIIVVDDGSTDGSAEPVKALGIPNLTLIQQANKGVSAARNLGVARANTPYVAFLDADDQWTPFFLYEMQALIKRFPQKALYGCRYQKLIDKQRFADAKIKLSNLLPQGYAMHDYFEVASKGDLPFMVSSSVVRCEYFKQAGGFPVDEWMGEDQSFFAQAALDDAIAYSPQIRLLYHTDAENRASNKRPPNTLCPFATRIMGWVGEGKLSGKQKQAAERYVAAHICDLAKRNVLAGYGEDARALLAHPLASRKPLHKAFWLTQSWLKSLTSDNLTSVGTKSVLESI